MSTPGPSTSTWQDMECLLSLSPSLLQWTTGAMAPTECKDKSIVGKEKCALKEGWMMGFSGGESCLLSVDCVCHSAQTGAFLTHLYTARNKGGGGAIGKKESMYIE